MPACLGLHLKQSLESAEEGDRLASRSLSPPLFLQILLGRLLMRHSTKELALVQEVIDQEKRIVLAKLEALNRRDEGKVLTPLFRCLTWHSQGRIQGA